MPHGGNMNPIGYLVIQDRLKIAVYEPGNKFHFFMMRLFFGWKYESCEESSINTQEAKNDRSGLQEMQKSRE